MVHDPALMTSMWHGKGSLLEDPDLYGHLVETAVGAYLIARSAIDGFALYWWRDGNLEVDFVLRRARDITAIEVKCGRVSKSGMGAFCKTYPKASLTIVGDRNTPLEDFLRGKVPLF